MNKWFLYYKKTSQSIAVKTAPVTKTGDEADIPEDADWTYQKVVILPGGSGSWDVNLTGALSPCTVIKKGDTYFLYYIGADGVRGDGGPRHRALGVAYSTDGLNFTKYNGNPILTFLPYNDDEEGIFSAGAFLNSNGEIVLYYSALDSAGTPGTVNSDIRLAISTNGLDFADQGEVLSHDDSGVWGYGDELFAAGTFHEGSTWYLYYIAQPLGWDLGLAQGSSRSNIDDNTQKVLEAGGDKVGQCHPVYISTSKLAVFIHMGSAGNHVRTAPANSPQTLSGIVETYPSTPQNMAIYLDYVEEEEEEIMQVIFI